MKSLGLRVYNRVGARRNKLYMPGAGGALRRHLKRNKRLGDAMISARGSYISAHVLLNYKTSWGKVIKGESCGAFYHFFATRLIDSII